MNRTPETVTERPAPEQSRPGGPAQRARLVVAGLVGALITAGILLTVWALSSSPDETVSSPDEDVSTATDSPAEPSAADPNAADPNLPDPSVPGLLGPGSGRVPGALTTAEELQALPTSGYAWDALLSAANVQSDDIDLSDEDSRHAAETLASALVHARTGDAEQRDHVVSVLEELPDASLSGARVLSVGRQLGGYALAADLVGYRDAEFTTWIDEMRTEDLGGHGRWNSISETSEDSANNWGTWAMATRIAVSSYLRDGSDLERAAEVFAGFTGEPDAYDDFRRTDDFDQTWACGDDGWVPINPASCGDRGGAIVEDISRSSGSYPQVDDEGLMYSWEVLGGATLSARLLERAGYRDVWSWGDQALLRAAQFVEDNGGYPPEYSVLQYIPHEINAAYGVDLGPVRSAGYGRQFGFSDWLR
ncbi:hypothetical protein [Blastococcus goldschmidtiae]|uniref:Alginate lyase n=1 Tax=Blastococcus goldschmidtiae TaxID=3075546 RepID=A0ABU2KB08_9ACTN|nr:hypothetical protein [Blastococcus sp. DSM 46792]MDT0277376.1 hypothetical protein [Blastococcus sp. DSM 46792]